MTNDTPPILLIIALCMLIMIFMGEAFADVLTPDYWTETEKRMEGC